MKTAKNSTRFTSDGNGEKKFPKLYQAIILSVPLCALSAILIYPLSKNIYFEGELTSSDVEGTWVTSDINGKSEVKLYGTGRFQGSSLPYRSKIGEGIDFTGPEYGFWSVIEVSNTSKPKYKLDIIMETSGKGVKWDILGTKKGNLELLYRTSLDSVSGIRFRKID